MSWPSETRFAYDGLVHSVIPTLVNAVLGDDVGPEFIGASERAPGSYTASVTGLTGADRGNYTISPDSVSWFIYDDVTEKKTLKILFTGNSLSQDARMKLPDAAALVPFLADADVEFGSLYQRGRSLGYFANCARVEKGESEFNLRYYLFTNATERSKPNLFTAEQKEKFGVVDNGYGNPYFNFCEYWKWDKTKRAWVCEKNADNLGEKTIEYAMNQNKWDLVVLQGFYCDFFGEEYDAINPKTTFKASAAKECIQDNLTYLRNHLTELQPGVKLAFYMPPAHDACVAVARGALSESEAADLTVERTIEEEGETISFKFGYTTSEPIHFSSVTSEE